MNLEAAGNTLSIRAEVPQGDGRGNQVRYQQTLTVPQFLDIEKLSAKHEHGMLQLTLPLKESVKPRRIQIEVAGQRGEAADRRRPAAEADARSHHAHPGRRGAPMGRPAARRPYADRSAQAARASRSPGRRSDRTPRRS